MMVSVLDRIASMTKISLITSTLGRQKPIIRLLQSLERQSYRNFEIIVVDQNAPGFLDDTLAPYAGTLDLKRIHSPKGLSRGRNAALPQVSGDIIAFPDDDCWYRPETLSEIAALMAQHPDHGMLLGRTTDENGRNSIVPSLAASCDIDRLNVIDAANSNSIFVRRDAAQAIGPFDERLGVGAATVFQGAEDRDYIARALALGVSCRFIAELTVFHDQVDTANGDHLARIRKYALGDGAYYRKHNYGIERILYMTTKAMGGIPLRLLRGQPAEVRHKLAYCRALFGGFMTWDRVARSSA